MRVPTIRRILLCAVLTAFVLPGVASDQIPDPAPAHPELRPVLDQFGGEQGLAALMEEFMQLLLADAQLQPFFEHVDHERTKRHLTEQFCVILGGDCRYTGMDMELAHEGFDIRRADFNALIENLQTAMDRRGIPYRAQNKLLAVLAPMHRQIVTQPED